MYVHIPSFSRFQSWHVKWKNVIKVDIKQRIMGGRFANKNENCVEHHQIGLTSISGVYKWSKDESKIDYKV